MGMERHLVNELQRIGYRHRLTRDCCRYVSAVLPWKTDEHGMLLGVPHHDATLSGLALQNDTLCLALMSTAGRVVSLELGGIRQLCIADLWEATIIGYIFVWPIAEAPAKRRQAHQADWRALRRSAKQTRIPWKELSREIRDTC